MRRLVVATLVVAAACGGAAPVVRGPAPSSPPSARVNPGAGSLDLAGLLAPDLGPTLDQSILKGPIQPGSKTLVGLIPAAHGLTVAALHSGMRTAAVGLRERDHGNERWGRLMIPAERKIIAGFAADRSLGDWLIILDDVEVRGAPDPIPLTAYRWARADVEAYARCGIPASAIDSCTSEFYLRPQMAFWISRGPGAHF